jgi:hypothetical protein
MLTFNNNNFIQICCSIYSWINSLTKWWRKRRWRRRLIRRWRLTNFILLNRTNLTNSKWRYSLFTKETNSWDNCIQFNSFTCNYWISNWWRRRNNNKKRTNKKTQTSFTPIINWILIIIFFFFFFFFLFIIFFFLKLVFFR